MAVLGGTWRHDGRPFQRRARIIGRMNLWQRMKIAGRVLTRGADDDMPDGIKPPARASVCDPLSLSTVFRGVQVLQTAITGLPIHEMRGGVKLDTVSSLVLQPDVNRSRRDFLADMVASMVIDGNAFVRLVRFGGDIVSCEVLPPALVVVSDDGSDPAAPKLRYSYLGKDYTANDIVHCKFLNVPGRLRGLGPLSAAREEVEGAQMARDYKAKFYTDSSNIKGYLQTEEKVTPEIAKNAKEAWKATGTAADVKVLGSKLKYVPLDMKPADLQFLETQKFDTTQIARLLGIPASIMLAAVDGSNLTYSNIEQSWIEFADYTLAAYTGEIEELFNRLLPRGRTAAFDWDSSRRADMSDRYDAYASALGAGWMDVNEIRAREALPPKIAAPQPEGVNNEA
ncbi:MAG: phage portal protein [Bifidobacterium bifidum]|nr:MAG: phage portal protein [Bifidobacterium bifidum]